MNETKPFDLLVVGSGVSGLSAVIGALARQPGLRVGVVSKADLSTSATEWAQGGVAAVLGEESEDVRGRDDSDSVELHLADTLAAGAGLCDEEAVRVLVTEGPACVRDLVGHGAVFDTDDRGAFELAREGGHSAARVLHAGGAATGAEIQRALVEATRRSEASLFEAWLALDILVENGRCAGVSAMAPTGSLTDIRASHTLLATGGAGQLFAVTTNPAQSTGDGIAMALRAGVAVADVEFMQFHPTALHSPAAPRHLLSEALRGEGALLRDRAGNRFVNELSPRDAVSRAMTRVMLDSGIDYLWLDATSIEDFAKRFPTLAKPINALGLDPARDWLPVAPAAHYLSGGLLTDLHGATTMPGLWAAGEAACSGVHGANRLASNSLLEGLVFGTRVVEAIMKGKNAPEATGALRALLAGATTDGGVGARRISKGVRAQWRLPAGDASKARESLQRAMTAGAGVLRSCASLVATEEELLRLGQRPASSILRGTTATPADVEVANLVTTAQALLLAARVREESRGAHTRADFPDRSDDFRVRLVQ